MKKLVLPLLGLIAGLLVGVVYGQIRVQNLDKVYQAKIKEINQRIAQVQRRYSQGVAAQNDLEQQKMSMQGEVDKLTNEKQALAAQQADLKTKSDGLESKAAALEKKSASLETKAASLESRNAELTERLNKAEADRAALDQKQKQTMATLQNTEKALRNLDQKYDQCAEHNAKLYTIASEVIKKYENKGVMGALIEKEPFTQVKKVEMEKMVQDYKDKIDQQKMKTK